MTTVDQALETQLSNIEASLGKSRDELSKIIHAQGFEKHGQMVAWLKSEYGLGHGNANTLAHFARQQTAAPPASASGDPLDEIYTDKKSHMRPIHETLMRHIEGFGPFEVAPKKGYVSLRRKKQFAMLGPKTNSRFEVGINLKESVDHPLITAQKPGGMCQYIAALTDPSQVDDALIGVIRKAYHAAG